MKNLYDLNITIQEAKELLKMKIEKGANCPCCNQFVKAYQRSISSSMANGLIKLYDIVGINTVFHLEETLRDNNLTAFVRSDFPKLRFWGLIEQLEGIREDGSNRAGNYKITQRGEYFILNKLKVVKYVYVYNNKVLKTKGNDVNIIHCLGRKFNYYELIGDLGGRTP